ncbi:MAG TPA: porin family protein [Cytophagaceae bacterium]|nr:porin family protein [Cytophagaceae bacterium]
MKKFYLLLFIILGFNLSSYSQKRISFGVKVAATDGFVSSYFYQPHVKPGYSVGALAEVKLAGPLSVRAEALFSSRGVKDKVTITDAAGRPYASGYDKVTLNYFDLPVMAKLSFGKVVKPYFTAGAKGSLYLFGKETFPSISGSGTTTNRINPTKYDISAIGGFGLDFNIKALTLFTELRYNHGLVGVNLVNTKFRMFELSGGIRF